jgi:hypothetical protein
VGGDPFATRAEVVALSVDEPIDSSELRGFPTDVTLTRRGYILQAADANRVPVRAILFTVGVVVAVYLLGVVLYRLRTVLLIGLLAGFIALILNPLVVNLEKWKIRRRGVAVAIVTILAGLAFLSLAVAFGYPLVNGITHFARPWFARSSLAALSRPKLGATQHRKVDVARRRPR